MERVRRLFTDPVTAGRLTLPPPGLVGLAAVGAVLLLVVAVTRWSAPSDEHAYWLAARRLIDGQPLYDPTATPVTPYAYWYPPVLAQALVPVALVLPAAWFTVAWTVLMLGCLLWLAGGRVLVALAFMVYLPVAVEFWFRNIHLILAVLVVLSVERGWLASVGASIKLAPGLGIPWLAARGRWPDAGRAVLVGVAIMVMSVALSPQAWADWLTIVGSRGAGDVASFLPLPFWVRAIAGLAIVLVAGRLRSPWAEVGLVVGITVAMPTLWTTALSLLIAVVPMWRRHRHAVAEVRALPAAGLVVRSASEAGM